MAPMPIKPIRSAIMSSHLDSGQGAAFRPGQVAHTPRCTAFSWARRSTREDVGQPSPGEGTVSIGPRSSPRGKGGVLALAVRFTYTHAGGSDRRATSML